jgi:hypothetical protein
MSWAKEEFAQADLGDKRLNKRLIKLVEQFADKPTASIPGACGGWAETQAAYRFFNQAKDSDDESTLDWFDILNPHTECTEFRIRKHPVVLCLQDTTELNFQGRDIEGLGPLSYEAQRGMYLHPTYVVTPQREPLGIVDAWIWSREFKDADGYRPGVAESQRWIEGYERVAEMALKLTETRLVYVADREADIVAMMRRAVELGEPADWLVRSKHNRAIPEGGKMWADVLLSTALGEIEFMLPARGNQRARMVRQNIYAKQVTISNGKKGKLTATCIIAKEINAPKGCLPVEWRLITNRKVESFEDGVEIIDWYRCRWEIEVFFNVLKNGCRVEALQLGSKAKLELAVVIYMVVAWRLAHLVRQGRTNPSLVATELFSEEEWQGAYVLAKKPIPSSPPTIREVIR